MFRKLISIALSFAIAVTTLSVVADAKSEKIESAKKANAVPTVSEAVESIPKRNGESAESGNPTRVKVSSNAESCAIEDGGEYYIAYGAWYDELACILERDNWNVTGQMFGPCTADSKMTFHLTEDGYFKIENDGKYLERSETGDNFCFNDHNYGKGQDWIVEPFEDGYKIKSRVESAKRYIGIGLESAYLGKTGQKLRLFKANSINKITSADQIVSGNRYTIASRESGKYLYANVHDDSPVYAGARAVNFYSLFRAESGYYCMVEDYSSDYAYFIKATDNAVLGSQGGNWRDYDCFRFVPAYDGFAIQTKSGKYLCVKNTNPIGVVELTDTIDPYYGVWYLYEYSKEILTRATYTQSKNYMSSQTDALGNTVSYSYDESKGILLSSTDAKGNQTSYSYDINDRVTNVSQGGISVNYTYDSNNQLSTVTHNGTSYSLIYDALGRSKQTKIGTRLLVDNMYFAESGLLRKAAYGNGSTREYEYDRQGRVKKLIIDGVDRFSYTYDSQGNLLSYTDLVANEKFTYVYDFLGRPVQVRTSSGFKIKLTYDEFNRASDVEFVNGTESNKTSWIFGNDSIVTGVKYNGVEKISYTYDLLKRQTKKTLNTTVPFTTSYEYKNIDNYRTSTLIDKISYSDGTALSYTYDANGNILTIADATGTVIASYTYDSLNQLTGATVGSDVYTYTYDNGGNIVSKTKNGVEVAYTYGNNEWKDLLTNYNGVDITYDTIGNPLNWINGEQFDWSGGRQLTGIVKGDNTISYTYNDSGIRTSKTVNGVRTDYYLNGTAIIMQKTGDNVIWYTYDENGNVAGMNYNGSDYWFYRNAQNDVIGIVDSSGAVVAKYTYDDWGKVVAVTDGQGNDISSNATHIANVNPIRYRGYYYDAETGLYYLQSRYYDAEVGRFINADKMFDSQSVLGYNLFAYCGNNPITGYDPTGEWDWGKFVGGLAMVGAAAVCVASVALSVVSCGTLSPAMAVVATVTVTAAVAYATEGVAEMVEAETNYNFVRDGMMGGNEAVYEASKVILSTTMEVGTAVVSAGACFIAGTSVSTEKGEVPIETVQEGDYVYAWDEKTGDVELKRVARTFIKEVNELVHIDVGGEEIICTNEHPFYVPQKGWISACKLRAGDILVLLNGKYAVVEQIQHEILEEATHVYNFEVEDFHTYFVGRIGILVHNKCGVQTGNAKKYSINNSRNAAYRNAKRYANIPVTEHPTEVVQSVDKVGKALKGRTYIFKNGTRIMEHASGHTFENGIKMSRHFNIYGSKMHFFF